jgi:hypothetical protein
MQVVVKASSCWHRVAPWQKGRYEPTAARALSSTCTHNVSLAPLNICTQHCTRHESLRPTNLTYHHKRIGIYDCPQKRSGVLGRRAPDILERYPYHFQLLAEALSCRLHVVGVIGLPDSKLQLPAHIFHRHLHLVRRSLLHERLLCNRPGGFNCSPILRKTYQCSQQWTLERSYACLSVCFSQASSRQ